MGSTQRVGLVYDPVFLQHVAPVDHPECPERLEAGEAALRQQGYWERFSPVFCREATAEELNKVHDEVYLEHLRQRIRGESGYLDPDTYYSPASVDAALRAAGGTVELVNALLSGEIACGLALVRPPGHHAFRRSASGFCILGNVAIAAAAARDSGKRVAIVDFDVHHGNGTQAAFYKDPAVLFISLHRYGNGFYPGTGAASETGEGEGRGATLNIPLPAGSGNKAYLATFDEKVGPALARFHPDVMLVSAGFDAHARDPLGGMAVDDEGFAAMIARLQEWADDLCAGKWAAVLEGGYDLSALSTGVVSLARAMLGRGACRENSRGE